MAAYPIEGNEHASKVSQLDGRFARLSASQSVSQPASQPASG